MIEFFQKEIMSVGDSKGVHFIYRLDQKRLESRRVFDQFFFEFPVQFVGEEKDTSIGGQYEKHHDAKFPVVSEHQCNSNKNDD